MYIGTPKVTEHLGYFLKKICHQELSKIAQTGLPAADLTPERGQMSKLFFKIWPFSKFAYYQKIAKVGFKTMQNNKLTQNTFDILPMWRKLSKSGHTVTLKCDMLKPERWNI